MSVKPPEAEVAGEEPLCPFCACDGVGDPRGSELGQRRLRPAAAIGSDSLAWLLAQGDDLVPIPGTRRLTYLRENLEAATIELSKEDLERIGIALPEGAASGKHYAVHPFVLG